MMNMFLVYLLDDLIAVVLMIHCMAMARADNKGKSGKTSDNG